MVKSLQQGKYRQMYGKFVVEGEKLVYELLHSGFRADRIYALDNWNCPVAGIQLTRVNEAELERISGFSTPNKVLAVVSVPSPSVEISAEDSVLVLEDIHDPGNMGTLLRTADWFGLKHVVCSENTVDCFHPKVVQASMGSIFRVQVHVKDLPVWMPSSGKGFIAAVPDGQTGWAEGGCATDSLVIGSESHGISDVVLKCCKKKITIPRVGYGDSLNAAVSAGILMSRLYL